MDVVDIASGEAHTLVATRDNGVVTFGRGGEGQLGSGKWDSGNLFCEVCWGLAGCLFCFCFCFFVFFCFLFFCFLFCLDCFCFF